MRDVPLPRQSIWKGAWRAVLMEQDRGAVCDVYDSGKSRQEALAARRVRRGDEIGVSEQDPGVVEIVRQQ